MAWACWRAVVASRGSWVRRMDVDSGRGRAGEEDEGDDGDEEGDSGRLGDVAIVREAGRGGRRCCGVVKVQDVCSCWNRGTAY